MNDNNLIIFCQPLAFTKDIDGRPLWGSPESIRQYDDEHTQLGSDRLYTWDFKEKQYLVGRSAEDKGRYEN